MRFVTLREEVSRLYTPLVFGKIECTNEGWYGPSAAHSSTGLENRRISISWGTVTVRNKFLLGSNAYVDNDERRLQTAEA